MVELLEIGVIQCEKEEQEHTILSHIQPDEIEEEIYDVTVNLAEQFVESLLKKDFASMISTSRIHEFPTSEAASANGGVTEIEDEVSGTRYRMFQSLREGDSFADDLDDLGTAYNEVAYTRSGILLAVRHERDDESFLSVIKAPFQPGYEPQEDVGIAELGDVIGEDLQKGSIFPRYNEREGEVHPNEIEIYQSSWAKHWWRFHGVEEAKTQDEILAAAIASEISEEESPLNEITSVREFSEIIDEYSDDELGGEVDITIDGVSIKVQLRDILEEKVFIVDDGAYYLVIQGTRPTIRTKHTSHGREEILENLEEYHSFDDIQ